jgi:hypothetical protein
MELVRLPSRRRTGRLSGRFEFSLLVAVSPRRPPLGRVGFSWISLDSLVRIEPFHWVTRLEAGTIFPRTLSMASATPERQPTVLACGRARLFMGIDSGSIFRIRRTFESRFRITDRERSCRALQHLQARSVFGHARPYLPRLGPAGCRLDWRPLANARLDHGRSSPHRPIAPSHR